MTSAGRAREWGRKVLAEWGLAGQVETVELIVSELVTNALRHGEGQIRLGLAVAGRDLWVEVADDADRPPTPRQAGLGDTSGRGLEIVAALLAMRGGVWGTEGHGPGGGKTVFAALPVDAG